MKRKSLWAARESESGQVSIITVTMFILIFSVVVISFTQIMLSTSRQAQNDELNARAVAAAESGIEDAKRMLAYCYEEFDSDGNGLFDTVGKPPSGGCEILASTLDGQGCNDILSSTLTTSVGLSGDQDANNQVRVGNNGEYYLCLKITSNPESVTTTLDAETGDSKVIPMKWVDSSGKLAKPDYINIKWSDTKSPLAGGYLPNSDWQGPAVLRLEAVNTFGGYSTDALNKSIRALTIRPSSDSSKRLISESFKRSASITVADATESNVHNGGCLYNDSTSSLSGVVPLDCFKYSIDDDINGNSHSYLNSTGYASSNGNKFVDRPIIQYKCGATCSFSFTVKNWTNVDSDIYNTSDLNENTYLRLQSIYKEATVEISAGKNGGTQLYYAGGQAAVDVTGRAVDSFRRLEARLESVNGGEDEAWWPDYAIESASKICKNMSVFAANGSDNCSYSD